MRCSVVACLLLAGVLSGCYGTVPPAPLSSRFAPPGLGGATIISRPIPVELSELLAAYRKSVLEQAHLLPPAKAAQFADDDLAMVKQRYPAESDLKAELTKRLQAQRQPAVPGRRPAAALYPQNPADEQGKDAR